MKNGKKVHRLWLSLHSFAYSAYENRAKKMDCPVGVMPKIAELIQADYDEKWFADPSIRTVSTG